MDLLQSRLKPDLPEQLLELILLYSEDGFWHRQIVELLDSYPKTGYPVLAIPSRPSDDMEIRMQMSMFQETPLAGVVQPFKSQLLKWIGNKQRFAFEIASYFPRDYGTYFEPFLGSGAVLGTLSPKRAIGSDVFPPLMEIWMTLREAPEELKNWYASRWRQIASGDKAEVYERVRASYKCQPERRRSSIPMPRVLRWSCAVPPSGWPHVHSMRNS